MKTKTSILTITKAFFILLVMCCFSCSNVKNNDNVTINKLSGGQEYRIEIIDSCEYIGHYSGYGYHLTHKGNCKFCTKRSLK
jgi:hypothetical protein